MLIKDNDFINTEHYSCSSNLNNSKKKKIKERERERESVCVCVCVCVSREHKVTPLFTCPARYVFSSLVCALSTIDPGNAILTVYLLPCIDSATNNSITIHEH